MKCMCPSQGPCSESQLGLLKSTNSDGNIKRGQVVICKYIYTIDLMYRLPDFKKEYAKEIDKKNLPGFYGEIK